MAGQYPKLVNKQFNSPINLYSDRNVKEVLERETRILSNGAVGIDFNNPHTNKPANLQNSAVLRMLEEEENRKRDGQPGSLKRVAWPPSESEFEEQAPVQSQGGPIYSSKSAPGLQNSQASTQQPLSPNYQQVPQSANFQPATARQAASPNYQQAPQSPNIQQASAVPYQSGQQSSYQSTPVSPVVNQSAVSSSPASKPWVPVQSPSFNQLQFRSVQAPQSVTKSVSKQTYQTNQTSVQEYKYSQEYKSGSFSESISQQRHQAESQPQQRYQATPQTQQYQPTTQPAYQSAPQSPRVAQTPIAPTYQATPQSPRIVQTQPQYQPQPQPTYQTIPQSPRATQAQPQYQPQPQTQPPLSPKVQTSFSQQSKPLSQPSQIQPATTPAQAVPQSQAPNQYTSQPAAAKPVEPPPSTITLRPQAPVSQAPPPVITSQPATATLRGRKNLRGDLKWPPEAVREKMEAEAQPPIPDQETGGKNLRGDLKWPPEVVKEKMEAEKQHLLELQKGPAVKPRKQHKDYSRFFAEHALNSTYPGYKIPPGTQFYEHNPVM